jgi:valyl-tRNA synthetase
VFAPVLPYITEEVWSWTFAEETGRRSIHTAPWPSDADFAGIGAPASAGSFEVAVACLAVINKRKSEAGVSIGRAVDRLQLATAPATREQLDAVRADVMAAARVARCDVQTDASLDGGFRVDALELAPVPEA